MHYNDRISTQGHTCIIDELVLHGTDTELQNTKYGTPLHVACANGHSR